MVMQRRLQVLHPQTSEGWMDSAIKVGFASTDMTHVDQHFGAARSFAIYSVDAERSLLLEVVQFDSQAMDGNESKLAPKIAALEGCTAVYAQAAGASAIGQLKKKGIQPIKVAPYTSVSELLRCLQEELREGSTVWLTRAMTARKTADPDRFRQMDAEGWEE